MKQWHVSFALNGKVYQIVISAKDSFSARELVYAQYGKDIRCVSVTPM